MATASDGSPLLPRRPARSRWASFIDAASDPLFLLDQHLRLRDANPAWEQLTGLVMTDVRGASCSGRRRPAPGDRIGQILHAHRVPAEVLQGQVSQLRRADPSTSTSGSWWDLLLLPLVRANELCGVLGRIQCRHSEPSGQREEQLAEHLLALRGQLAYNYPFALLDSEEPVLAQLRLRLSLACQTRSPVWLHGPRGSGKTTLARIIHTHGLDHARCFVTVDARMLPANVLRMMLFGHAGLAESAQLGTLLLKEPGACSDRRLQSELLDWLGTANSPPRLLIATRKPPNPADPDQQLDPAFVAFSNVLEIPVPSLTARLNDLPRLVSHLLQRHASASQAELLTPTHELIERLHRYSWPGNLRELDQLLREMAARTNGPQLTPAELPNWLVTATVGPTAARRPVKDLPPLDQILEQVERRMLQLALHKAHGSKTEAAERLGIWRARLIRRLKALGLDEQAPSDEPDLNEST